ncbi:MULTISPECIES: hypothetical protein [Catenuloplanes]|uniref:Uncharacterized protein n=1 Tax=Catenuloplanes niger TaxID=587534 RepID=A0AAE4A288_9ACTN|nr:hypothetical protein [Catenuloplanes niger]MDR7327885.1 hypothetical protein [Catenuloplanes niger]
MDSDGPARTVPDNGRREAAAVLTVVDGWYWFEGDPVPRAAPR